MIKLNNPSSPNLVDSGGSVTIGAETYDKMQTLNGYVRERSAVPALLGSGNATLDASLQSLFRKSGGTCTITVSNMVENQQFNLAVYSTGSAYTLTFAGETFKWPNNTQPTPSSAASKIDVYSFIKINGIVHGNAVLGF